MTVAGRLPSRNWAIASWMSWAARPASPGTVEPAAALPGVPWQAPQATASERTPDSERFAAAKAGGGAGAAGCGHAGRFAASIVAAMPPQVMRFKALPYMFWSDAGKA